MRVSVAQFRILEPDLAILRVKVMEYDRATRDDFVGQVGGCTAGSGHSMLRRDSGGLMTARARAARPLECSTRLQCPAFGQDTDTFI